jgi:NAD+ kinase
MSVMPKRLLILANMEKPGVPRQVQELLPWFAARAEVLGVASVKEPLPDLAAGAELAVVFGGDGTLLAAGRLTCRLGIPLLGVNMGKLGFLAEYNVEHMQKHFEQALAGDVPVTRRMMFDVRAATGGKERPWSVATNDVCVVAGAPFRMIDLSLEQGGCLIARYSGDGVIVATPTGSTGYNMSVGGPILEPTIEAIAISPVAPHSLTLRPIVVRADEPIRVTAVRTNPGTTAIIDGQISLGLGQGDGIEVRRSQWSFQVLTHPGRHYYQTLGDKLGWGQSPHHPGEASSQ